MKNMKKKLFVLLMVIAITVATTVTAFADPNDGEAPTDPTGNSITVTVEE